MVYGKEKWERIGECGKPVEILKKDRWELRALREGNE
jgi:hypothetical protein